MKASIKGNFLIRNVAGEKVLIGNGKQIDFSKMLIINDTAAFIIQELQKGPKTSEELANLITEVYDITYSEALNDIEKLLVQLQELKVIILDNYI